MTAAQALFLAAVFYAVAACGFALADRHDDGLLFFRAATVLAAGAIVVAGYSMVTA